LLALVTFGKWVREAHGEILRQTQDPDFARAVATYLALAVDRLSDYSSLISKWVPDRETPQHITLDTI
jgi:putative DNA methylase